MTAVGVVLGGEPGGGDFTWHRWVQHYDAHPLHIMSRMDPAVVTGALAPYRLPWWAPIAEVRADIEAARRHAFTLLYDTPALRSSTAPDVAEVEAWLGEPLRHIALLNHKFRPRPGRQDVRDLDLLAVLQARIVLALRDWMQDARLTHLFVTMESNDVHKLAVRVAKRLGVRVLGLMSSRFPDPGWLVMEDYTRPVPVGPGLTEAALRASYADRPIHHNRPSTPGGGPWGRLKRMRDVARADRFFDGLERAHPEDALLVPRYRPAQAWTAARRDLRRRRAVAQAARPLPDDRQVVLFPLHEPDDAQMSIREPFLDQAALIRHAAGCLPQGTVLAVKPHPHRAGADITTKELRELAATPGVVLLDPASSPRAALQRADVVLSINSTLGMEAMLQGIPVVTVGHDAYRHPDAAYVVADPNDLPGSILKAMQMGARPGAVRLVLDVRRALIPVKTTPYRRLDDEDAVAVAAGLARAVRATS